MINYDKHYFLSILAILKIIEIIFCIVTITLLTLSKTYATFCKYSFNGYVGSIIIAFLVAACCGLIISFLILVISGTVYGQKMDGILKYQFILFIVFVIWFLVCSILLFVEIRPERSYEFGFQNFEDIFMAAMVFGLFDGIVYSIDVFISLCKYRPFCKVCTETNKDSS